MRKTLSITLASLAGSAALIAGLTGCGGSSAPAGQAAPDTATSQQAPAVANPVTIVRQAGATPAPGAKYGTTTINGLSADGNFTNVKDDYNETITVYTLPAGTTGREAIAEVGQTTNDSQTLIAGPNFFIYLTPYRDATTDAASYPVSPATVAARVHGTVIPPAS